jgi:hypothetical protein
LVIGRAGCGGGDKRVVEFEQREFLDFLIRRMIFGVGIGLGLGRKSEMKRSFEYQEPRWLVVVVVA